MLIRGRGRGTKLTLALLIGLTLAPAAAQVEPRVPATAAISQPATRAARAADAPDGSARDESAVRTSERVVEALTPASNFLELLLPRLDGGALTWVAVMLILTLTFQIRPLFSWHNLDGLSLAAIAILLPLRADLSIGALPGGYTVQWWTYLALSMIAGYWLLRGLGLFFAQRVPMFGPNVSEGAMCVLLVAGLLIAFQTILTAPTSASARDGLVGGLALVETGALPYGDAPGVDRHSPLLYAVYAGAAQVAPPFGADGALLSWADRRQLSTRELGAGEVPAAIRLVNASLFLLMFLGILVIGLKHHSLAMAQTIAAIFCVFPAAAECLNRPDLMMPAMLVTWSLALVGMPGLGGLLSVATLVLAGAAAPWAWLGLPLLLAHFFRRGIHALGALIGLGGGFAALAYGLALHTQPALPRDDGALRAAGVAPKFVATLGTDESKYVLSEVEPTPPAGNLLGFAWKWLLEQDDWRLGQKLNVAAPTGVDGAQVRFREVAAEGAARDGLQRAYRRQFSGHDVRGRFLPAVRTLLEATAARGDAEQSAGLPGAWELWAGADGDAGVWSNIRRAGKVTVGLLSLVLAFLLFGGGRKPAHQLVGGMLALLAASQLVSESGAVQHLVWMTPLMLAALAVQNPAGLALPVASVAGAGPAPRITITR